MFLEAIDMQMHFTKEEREKLRVLADQYELAFGERPAAYCMPDPIAEIERCLDSGKPSKFKPNPGTCY